MEPSMKPEALVPVARFGGSRLASAPVPSPYQPMNSLQSEKSFSFKRENHIGRATNEMSVLEIQAKKVARMSSSQGTSIGAALVEAENSLEVDVCFNFWS